MNFSPIDTELIKRIEGTFTSSLSEKLFVVAISCILIAFGVVGISVGIAGEKPFNESWFIYIGSAGFISLGSYTIFSLRTKIHFDDKKITKVTPFGKHIVIIKDDLWEADIVRYGVHSQGLNLRLVSYFDTVYIPVIKSLEAEIKKLNSF